MTRPGGEATADREGPPQRPSALSDDPRAARSRIAVLAAAVDELGAVGYGRFSIESVAVRARVAKSTVYRHWPDKLAVIADALETFHQELVPAATGMPREQLVGLIEHVAAILFDSPFAACIPALVDGAQRDDAVASFHFGYSAARRAELASVIRAGIDQGEVASATDVDLAVVMLLGPLFYQRLMSTTPFEPSRARQLVDSVLGQPT
jgi:TetR/AcrR family transcriptional regulator, regulator of autoinduction and epiphytic fitness